MTKFHQNSPNFQKVLHLFLSLIVLILFINWLFAFDPAAGILEPLFSVLAFSGEPLQTRIDPSSNSLLFFSTNSLPDNLLDRRITNIYAIQDAEQKATFATDKALGAYNILALFHLFFRTFGFRLGFALPRVLIFILLYLIIIKISQSRLAGFIGAIIFALSEALNMVRYFHPIISGISVLSLLFFAIIVTQKGFKYLFLVGMLFGVLVGIEHTAILLAPLLFLNLKKKKFLFMILALLSGFLITALPYAYWHKYAFNRIFIHETQIDAEFLSDLYIHSFGPFKFKFNGMLNFPFYSQIVRTPGYPLPVFLYIPLWLNYQCGIGLISFLFLGFISLDWKNPDSRRFNLGIFIWLIIWYLFLAVQENWDEYKQTYSLWLFPPLLIISLVGAKSIFTRFHFFKALLVSLNLSVAFILPLILSQISFPEDPRYYQRHGHNPELPDYQEYLNKRAKETSKGIFNPQIYPQLLKKFFPLIKKPINLKLELAEKSYFPCSEERLKAWYSAIDSLPSGSVIFMHKGVEDVVLFYAYSRKCFVALIEPNPNIYDLKSAHKLIYNLFKMGIKGYFLSNNANDFEWFKKIYLYPFSLNFKEYSPMILEFSSEIQ